MPIARISLAVATPIPPKPRMPQFFPDRVRLRVCWLNAPAAMALCSISRRLAAAKTIAQGVLGHCVGVGAAVAGDGDVGGQGAQGHEVDAGGHELDQAGRLDLVRFIGAEVSAGVDGRGWRWRRARPGSGLGRRGHGGRPSLAAVPIASARIARCRVDGGRR